MKEKKKQRPLLINDDLYKKAVERSGSMGLSFAAYVRMVLLEDINKNYIANEKKE
jgi:hypothetical protein